MNIATLFKNSFFYRSHDPGAAFGYSNQSKIFREISASKFQGEHAAQFRYSGPCSVAKTEIHHGCFLQNFRTATFENNFGRLLLEEEKDAYSDPCSFRFLLFSGHILIKS